MGNNTADTLLRIAAEKAADGRGWDALAAQLTADALLVDEAMSVAPEALLDISPLRTFAADGDGLAAIAAGYRAQLLKGLEGWGLSGKAARALPPLELPHTPLDPATAGDFAALELAGAEVGDYVAAQQAKAARLAALASRLRAAGQHGAALRSARGADRATFKAHLAAESAATGDAHLTVLRTGLLLADELLQAAGADPAACREAYARANLTEAPIAWEDIPGLV